MKSWWKRTGSSADRKTEFGKRNAKKLNRVEMQKVQLSETVTFEFDL
jgi:hypothetical protein